jgi:membrane fusion protein, heavy metal efflux system
MIGKWMMAATAAGVAILAGCGHQAPPAQTASGQLDTNTVTITDAQRGEIVTEAVAKHRFLPEVATTGTVTWDGDRSTQVISSLSGPVQRLLVNLGDSVAAGQPLASVVSPDFASAVADYRKADAAWRNARRIATLDEKLFANDALARTDLDQARSDLDQAIADRDAASQELASLGLDSSAVASIVDTGVPRHTAAAIRAPIAGTIVERLITPGQLLQAGSTPAFTIADLSTMWVMANVFQGDVTGVRKGAPAMITIAEAGDSFPGRVDYVGAEVDPASKATAVRIVVPNREHELRANMLVNVDIRETTPRLGVTIPVSAVLRDDQNLPFVFVAGGPTRFLRRRITLGARSGDAYEVSSGLAPGDTVVTQGALYLEEAASQ